ncbi:hypothetical protein [Nocardiopsis algeriensis]|uniref:Uncharacterized protein n=1 Tax=Nocardiopsis algeriensis TaxID=1478215 RepID=A0A841IL18_9ACTN|nr:hypothetical protein [Nocardiopsis algeriensis]MBB6119479.1 hypothetical protein [Nocardiopsis algeriensis]
MGHVKHHSHQHEAVAYPKLYRQDSAISKPFEVLADKPECYVHSDAVRLTN